MQWLQHVSQQQQQQPSVGSAAEGLQAKGSNRSRHSSSRRCPLHSYL
jgi:hypothetical protein